MKPQTSVQLVKIRHHLVPGLKKQQYRYLLKSADVNWQNLMGEQQLTQKLIQKGFTEIEIQDFSEPVLNGFALHIENKKIVIHLMEGLI